VVAKSRRAPPSKSAAKPTRRRRCILIDFRIEHAPGKITGDRDCDPDDDALVSPRSTERIHLLGNQLVVPDSFRKLPKYILGIDPDSNTPATPLISPSRTFLLELLEALFAPRPWYPLGTRLKTQHGVLSHRIHARCSRSFSKHCSH